MKSSTFSFQAPDDAEIHVFKWLPESSVRGVVQIAHGLAEHAGRYARLAEELTKAGFAVYANDHRGHGETAKREEDVGIFAEQDGWARVLADLHQLNGIVRKENPGVPVIVMGHSMGSFFVQHMMFVHPDDADAVVMSGTNGKPPPIATVGMYVAKLERARLGKRGKSRLLHSMGFGAFNKEFKPARTELDWLSRDAAEVDKYIADQRCGFVSSTQLWIDLLFGLDVIARADNQARVRKDLPVYMFAGSRDPVGGFTAGVTQLIGAYQKAGLNNIEHRFYEGARHETLNETNRAEVMGHLVAWLDKIISARASAAAA
jgi:alpha-beta hydrolase superfamily lysophospholipase